MGTANPFEGSAVSVAQQAITIRDIKWLAYVPIGLCLILVGWLYMPTFRWWYNVWMADESYYSHGILIPIISGFIVWLKKKALQETRVEPAAVGFLFAIPLLAVILLASWANVASLRGLTFPPLLALLVMLVFGIGMTKAMAFPIGYLYFMCVLPGFILTKLSFKIQMLSTTGGTMILRGLTMDAYQEGAVITLPNVLVEVGAPCSGFRLLISLFAFSVLFAYLKEGPWWGKALLVAFTLPLSLVVNSIRIALIAVVGEFMGSEAMHSFHDYSGYIVLILAFVVLSFFARLVKCRKFNSTLMP